MVIVGFNLRLLAEEIMDTQQNRQGDNTLPAVCKSLGHLYSKSVTVEVIQTQAHQFKCAARG
jgi:hypothetical protein